MTDKVKAQHTPGPWRIGLRFGLPVIIGSDGKTVADVLVSGGVRTLDDPAVRGEVAANADLLKAAPELLAALEAARLWIAHSGSDHDSHCAHSCNGGGPCDCPVPAMDAAIRKARGEA